MTFTRLTRQQKDVRNEKCKEEEECTICLPTTGLSCEDAQSYNAGAKNSMTGPSNTLLCSNNTWTYITAYLETQHLLLCDTACGAL